MKSRKRKRKMRGGGIFGPVFSSHIDTAGNQASQGLNKVLSGWNTTKKVGRQEMTNFRVAHNENLRSDTIGGVKSTQPKVDISDKLRKLAIARRTQERHGKMGFGVAKQIRAAKRGLPDPAKSNPLFSPMKSRGREAAFAERAKATAEEQGSTSNVPKPINFERQISYGGRKTKKRRKRKKKKTKRKKRRRKRKTKKRRRR
jgi:hypothetical protein